MGLNHHINRNHASVRKIGDWSRVSVTYSNDVEICDYDEDQTYVAYDDDRSCIDCNCLAPPVNCVISVRLGKYFLKP